MVRFAIAARRRVTSRRKPFRFAPEAVWLAAGPAGAWLLRDRGRVGRCRRPAGACHWPAASRRTGWAGTAAPVHGRRLRRAASRRV